MDQHIFYWLVLTFRAIKWVIKEATRDLEAKEEVEKEEAIQEKVEEDWDWLI